MTTRLTSHHAWKLWHEAWSALVRPEGPDQSTRQMANLPQVYIAPLLQTLRRPANIPHIFNLAAVLAMNTLITADLPGANVTRVTNVMF